MWQERASPIQANSKTLRPANENTEPIQIALEGSRLDERALREDCMRVGQHKGQGPQGKSRMLERVVV